MVKTFKNFLLISLAICLWLVLANTQSPVLAGLTDQGDLGTPGGDSSGGGCGQLSGQTVCNNTYDQLMGSYGTQTLCSEGWSYANAEPGFGAWEKLDNGDGTFSYTRFSSQSNFDNLVYRWACIKYPDSVNCEAKRQRLSCGLVHTNPCLCGHMVSSSLREDPAGSGKFKWQCISSDGMEFAECTTSDKGPTCGYNNNKTFIGTCPTTGLCEVGSAVDVWFNTPFSDEKSGCFSMANGNCMWRCETSIFKSVDCQTKYFTAGCCSREYVILKNGQTLNTLSPNLCRRGKVSQFKQTSDGSYSWCCLGSDDLTETCGCYAKRDGSPICGTSGDKNFISAPKSNLCLIGSASSVTAVGNKFTWSCNNDGRSVGCSANKVTKAYCGLSGELSTPLTVVNENLCNPGSVANFKDSGQTPDYGPWSWDCLGGDPNSSADDDFGCSAKLKAFNGECGSAVGEVKSRPIDNYCAKGSFSGFNVDDSSAGFWQWRCLGSNDSISSDDALCDAYLANTTPNVNQKDPQKYRHYKYNYQNNQLSGDLATKEIFLVPSTDWWQVMSLVPLTTWTEADPYSDVKVVAKPTFVYYVDNPGNGQVADMDSIIHTAQLYGADQATVVGDASTQVTDLLYAPKPVGAQIPSGNIVNLNFKQDPASYFAYWRNYKEVVYSVGNYQTAQIASIYASLINAPLVIDGTPLDNDLYLGGKQIICFGQVNDRPCQEIYNTLPLMQSAYIDKVENVTGQKVNKLLITNVADLNFNITLDDKDLALNTKKTGRLRHLLGKSSLAAPFLSAAKYELTLPFNEPISSYDCADSSFDCYKIRDQVIKSAGDLGLSEIDKGTYQYEYNHDLFSLKIKDGTDFKTLSVSVPRVTIWGDKIFYFDDGFLRSYDFISGKVEDLDKKEYQFIIKVKATDNFLAWSDYNLGFNVFNLQTKTSIMVPTDNINMVDYKMDKNFILWNTETVVDSDGQKYKGEAKLYVLDTRNNQQRNFYTSSDYTIGNIFLARGLAFWQTTSRDDFSQNALYSYDYNNNRIELIANLSYDSIVAINDYYIVWTSDFGQKINYFNLATKETKEIISSERVLNIFASPDIFYLRVGSTDQINFKELALADSSIKDLFVYDGYDEVCLPYNLDFVFDGDFIYFHCQEAGSYRYQEIFKYNRQTGGGPTAVTLTTTVDKEHIVADNGHLAWLEDTNGIPRHMLDGYLTVVGDAYSVPYLFRKGPADKKLFANTEGPIFYESSPVELPVGRLTGYTVSDVSSQIVQSIFYKDLVYNRGVALYASAVNGDTAGTDWLSQKACSIFSTSGYSLNDCSAEGTRDHYIDKFTDCSRRCLCDNDYKYKQDYESKNGVDSCGAFDCTTATSYCDQETKQRISEAGFRSLDADNKFINIALFMMDKEGKNWQKNTFIYYYDHGNDNFSGIYNGNVPELDSSLVIGNGCDTAKIYTNFKATPDKDGYSNRRSIALTALRQGAVAFIGSSNTSYTWHTGEAVANDTYYLGGKSLGQSFSERSNPNREDVLLGDPTLIIGRDPQLNEAIY